jgi:hypothetical protein
MWHASMPYAWLTSTASLPETGQSAAHIKGGERYDKLLEALGRRLARDRVCGRKCRRTCATKTCPIRQIIG